MKKVHQIVPTTTVYVTHDQIEAMTLADRVVVMNGGRIEQVGAPQELYHRPASRFVAGFIGSPGMNFLPAHISDGSVRLANGTLLAIPAARLDRYAGLAGSEMVFGIRPEHLTDSPAVGRAGFAPLTATADVVEPMGAETLVHLRMAGTPVSARCTPDTAAAPGAPLALWADMNQMHLIDGTGRVV